MSANSKKETDEPVLAQYAHTIKDSLEAVLKKAGLNLWLMIDRLDEIFPRRTELETRALRGLLRTLRIFESQEIRIKVFLRDDILEQVVSDGQGFTALTHITARQADTLRWSEDQILTMIVKRLYASKRLQDYLNVNSDRLAASQDYQKEAFYKVFPKSVFPGEKQSSTLRWIYTHTSRLCRINSAATINSLLLPFLIFTFTYFSPYNTAIRKMVAHHRLNGQALPLPICTVRQCLPSVDCSYTERPYPFSQEGDDL